MLSNVPYIVTFVIGHNKYSMRNTLWKQKCYEMFCMMKYITNDPSYIIIKKYRDYAFYSYHSKIQFLEIHYSSEYSMNVSHRDEW